MPEDLHSVSTGADDLYFGDDLSGIEFELREATVSDADEVTDPGEVPEFGRWIPIRVDGRDAWAVALGELVQELQRLEAGSGDRFKVTRCDKSGSRQTDPYEVNITRPEKGSQDRL
jgi:hypothetical protein